MSIEILPWPRGKKSPVIIRDDDISFFTTPEMLMTLYRNAWKKGFAIDFGVIPLLSTNVHARPGMTKNPKLSHLKFDPCVPRFARGVDSRYDIGENQGLVRFLCELRNEGKCGLSLHGLSHVREEFLSKDYEKVRSNFEAATSLFSESFGFVPSVFVFPYWQCSQEAFLMVSNSGMHLFFDRPRSLFRRILNRLGKVRPTIKNNDSSMTFFPQNKISICSPIYGYSTADEALQDSKKIFLQKHKKGEVFWLIHHFWEFFFDWEPTITQPSFLEALNMLLDHITKFDVWKCTTADLANWFIAYEQLHIRRKSKDEISFESKVPIEGLALNIKGRLSNNETTRNFLKQIDNNKWIVDDLPPNQKISIKCS